ncbi:MAG: response regulator transcription factor [Chloroflexota bacterium]|jgi:DNA-binding response OmpR family regulator
MHENIHILLIEGKRPDRTSFLTGLTKKNFAVETAGSGSAALAYLETHLPRLIILDAASMRTSGKRICATLREKAPGVPIILILDANTPANGAPADVILHLPFTFQKLLNRIKPFLPQESKNLLRAGPIHLDIKNRSVHCLEHQAVLTPRLIRLLKELMDHAGQVIERETLFSRVWETDYTGDTRTLDVHISWLRQAIEEDPRRPRFIKTIRGLGYRLDVEDTHPVNGRLKPPVEK